MYLGEVDERTVSDLICEHRVSREHSAHTRRRGVASLEPATGVCVGGAVCVWVAGWVGVRAGSLGCGCFPTSQGMAISREYLRQLPKLFNCALGQTCSQNASAAYQRSEMT